MNHKELKITLKSDLCVGSGYSYAGIVDGDICYDECGLPYIPAKRLKGCMREAAELIGLSENEITALFGAGGKSCYGEEKISGIVLGNAYIEDYDRIYDELKRLNRELKEYVTPQSVLEQFTVVKAQTKIQENGVAKDTALRFTRAVKQYSPIQTEQELVFTADIEAENLTKTDAENLEMVVKALRNIGLNRNRGLGSVKCKLKDREEERTSVHVDVSAITDDEKVYVLPYTVKNTAPLVLNSGNDYATEKYISGQNVLGYFVAAYLKNGNSAEDACFADLFLKNKVIFSSLYPCESGKAEEVYYPAPSFIHCLKKTKKYVNVMKTVPFTEAECEEAGLSPQYASGNGNQPKKLKEKFVCIQNEGAASKILVKEVKTDISYHHTKKSDKQDSKDGELLYPFEKLSEQQFFTGTITGKGKYIKEIAKLLKQGKLRFGKSKSAQYGECILADDVKAEEIKDSEVMYPAGSRILVTLLGDGIFTNETGYTVRCKDVREIMKHALKIEESDSEEVYSEIEAKTLHGYYAKWNLKRQAIAAVRAGSTFEFLLKEDLHVKKDMLYVGERIGEGYGKLVIIKNDQDSCCICEAEKAKAEEIMPVFGKEICRRILLAEMKEKLRNAALKENIGIKNPSSLGRIVLMLKDSMDQYPEDAEQMYVDFCTRISSIKSKDKKDKILNVKKSLICAEDTLVTEKLKYLQYVKELVLLYETLMGDADESLEKELKKLWSDYFLRVLIQEKFLQKKNSGKESGSL